MGGTAEVRRIDRLDTYLVRNANQRLRSCNALWIPQIRICGSVGSLGVASLTPGTAGASFKGAISQNQATNDVGLWQGQVDDDGSNGFAEWGDDGDKNGLLLKLNVLGSDSSTNLFVVAFRSGENLQWDAKNLKATNSSAADEYIRKEYRQGWELAGQS